MFWYGHAAKQASRQNISTGMYIHVYTLYTHVVNMYLLYIYMYIHCTYMYRKWTYMLTTCKYLWSLTRGVICVAPKHNLADLVQNAVSFPPVLPCARLARRHIPINALNEYLHNLVTGISNVRQFVQTWASLCSINGLVDIYTVCTCTYSVYRSIQFEASLALYIHCMYTWNTCSYIVCTWYVHGLWFTYSLQTSYIQC